MMTNKNQQNTSDRKIQNKKAFFYLEPDGFSIHTMEIRSKLDGETHQEIVNYLYEMAPAREMREKPKKSGNYECTLYSTHGIRIKIRSVKVEAEQGHFSQFYIRMVVNPKKLIDPKSSYLGIFPAEESNMEKLCESFTALFQDTPIGHNLDFYKLFRLDLCTNIRCTTENFFSETMRVLKKLPNSSRYERIYQKSAEENKRTITLKNGSHSLVIYDKSYQIKKEKLGKDKKKGKVLRVELQCKRPYIKKWQKELQEPIMTEALWAMMQASQEKLCYHMNICFGDVTFLPKENIIEMIDGTKYRQKTKENQKELVELMVTVPEVEKALKKMKLTVKEGQALLKKFRTMGISPVPLRKNFGGDFLCGPLDLMRLCADDVITLPYTKVKYK